MKSTHCPLSIIHCQLSIMKLVFGGTTEGKKVASILEKEGLSYFYSTKTKIDFQPGKFGNYRYGAFTKQTLIGFCKAHNIRQIIHASHPFAEELHQTIYQVATELEIPVIRFERIYPERMNNRLIHYFSSYEEVITYLLEHNIQNLLALTGVQTIEKLKPYWQKQSTLFRILPRESSMAIAEQSGFPKEKLILAFPSEDIQQEVMLLQKHAIKAMLTKESGDSGFLNTKINVALQLGIPLFIIERCILPASFITTCSTEELISAISKTGVASVEGIKGIQ
jgi:precorrin-6A/cobalt-precorrin-6A reductase